MDHAGFAEDELNSRLILTERQRQVLQLIADGATLREIALELAVGHQYVKNLMMLIRQRLHAKSTAQAVAEALRKGIIL